MDIQLTNERHKYVQKEELKAVLMYWREYTDDS